MFNLAKRFVAVAVAGVALLFVAAADVRADGPSFTVEKGTPGSGIKEIRHVWNHSGLRLPFGQRAVEASRETVYVDGHKVFEILHANGSVSERTTTTANGHTITERYRPIQRGKLWTRTTDMKLGQVVSEYYGLDGRLQLIRVKHKNGTMDVTFDRNGLHYVQHWVSGIAGYVLSSVDVSAPGAFPYTRYVVLGRTATRIEHYGTDGSLDEVRFVKPNGNIDKIEHWYHGKLQSTTPGAGAFTSQPHWAFREVGGIDDPTAPR
jgi:hypothetical protein